ncbi:MAG: peptidoglycan DD-metalloendopeptidase family protein [Acidobacteriota bacterium]|nr:peptidoglycan DD-metalloendopeptidase family protein [Acidobacteriota bacterium]
MTDQPPGRPAASRRARHGAALVALLAVAAGALAFAQGQSRDQARTEAETQAQRAAARIQALQQEADALATQERSVLGDLRTLEVERELRAAEERQARAGAAAVAAQVADERQRIEALQQSAAQIEPALQARLVELYKLGRGGYTRLLLSTRDLRELGRAYRMVSALSARDRRAIADARQSIVARQAAQTALEARQAQMAALEARATRARAAADRAAAARSALLDQIDRRRDLTARLIGELQTAQQKLQATLAALAQPGTPAAAVPALPIAPFQGALAWPTDGRVVTPFHHAGAGAGFARDGIEIAAPDGQVVRAVHGGTVAFAGPFTGFGRLVIVDHGDRSYSLYGNLGALSVAKGDRVSAGQDVGRVGVPATGAPRLYFELQIDGQAVDPLQWLKARHP